MSRPRVAVVVQRYGAEVNGGAEVHARLVAELLQGPCAVEVLTTCAIDYHTWRDAYPPGPAELNGVPVLRFPVPRPREAGRFAEASRRAFGAPGDLEEGRRWIDEEGPISPGLIDHLQAHGSAYDAVVFVTYLYATTVLGMPIVRDRALLIPTLHDEPPARLAIFDAVFRDPRLIVFNTDEERELARRRFGVPDERAVVVGLGVDLPGAVVPGTPATDRPYAVCVGRLDPSKGTDELVAHHAAYRRARPDGLDLVLVGGGDMDLPREPWLHRVGFVSDEEKHAAVAGAAVVVVPSPYESLSLAQLEAWSHGRPTLANAVSDVLEGQSRRSGGGLWYRDRAEYAVMLDLLARSRPLAEAIGRQGRRWVERTCTWDRVRSAWHEAVARVAGGRAAA